MKAVAASLSVEATATSTLARAAVSPLRAFSIRKRRWPKMGSGCSMPHCFSPGLLPYDAVGLGNAAAVRLSACAIPICSRCAANWG